MFNLRYVEIRSNNYTNEQFKNIDPLSSFHIMYLIHKQISLYPFILPAAPKYPPRLNKDEPSAAHASTFALAYRIFHPKRDSACQFPIFHKISDITAHGKWKTNKPHTVKI